MTLLSLFFRQNNYRIGEIMVDAILSETHTMQATATSHPVESGSDISDHIQAQAITLQLEGIIADDPRRTLQTLEKLFYQAQLIDIVSDIKSYTNMVLEQLSAVKNAQNANTLRFSCTAKQVKMVNGSVIGLSKTQGLKAQPKIKSALPKKDLGKQPLSPAQPADAQKARSLLSYWLGGS